MRLVPILALLVATSSFAQGTAPAQPQAPEAKPAETKPAEAKPAEAKPAEAKSDGTSTLTVRCIEDCNVRVDGKTGMRKDTSTWEFKNVPAGQRRVEVTGGIFNRPLYNGYADIPGGMKVTAMISSSKKLTITDRAPLAPETEAKATGTAPSTLSVRCPKACTVSIDGARKGAGQSQNVVIHDVAPGDHNVEAKFVLGKAVRTVLNIPAGSEVFATATESGISITNSKPLTK
ncbi:MAG TPA: hypothetical protein VF815_09670 [Myxococcaceae bacterium]|jgi:hypothetical protein